MILKKINAWLHLQGYETAWFYYSFSAKKEIPAKKLTLTLIAVSPFGGYTAQSKIVRASDFTSIIRNQHLLRSVRVSINWEFGGMFKNTNTRKINNDDLKNTKPNG